MKQEMPVPREPGFRYRIPQEDAYVSDLRMYQRTRKDSPFMNDSRGHAMLLADMMISSADDYVLIYSRCILRPVYEFALTHIPGTVKVRVLYEQPDAKRWWEKLVGKDIVAHHLATPPVFKGKPVNHFFVCDGVSVRYEISDHKTTASANFNMPKVCDGLVGIFAKAWKTASGQELDIFPPPQGEGC